MAEEFTLEEALAPPPKAASKAAPKEFTLEEALAPSARASTTSTAANNLARAQAAQNEASKGAEQTSIPQAELADAQKTVAALTRQLRKKGVDVGETPPVGSTRAGDYLLAQGAKAQGQKPADVVAPPAPPPAPAVAPPAKPRVIPAAPASMVSGADDVWAAINDAAAAPTSLSAAEKFPRALPPVPATQTALNLAGVSPQYVASLQAEYNQLDPAKRVVALQEAIKANPFNTVKGRAVRAVAANDDAWKTAISRNPNARQFSTRVEDVAANIKARYPERPNELVMQDAQRAVAQGQSDVDYGSAQALTKEQSDAMDAAATAKANAEKSKKLSYADIGTSNFFGGLADVGLSATSALTTTFRAYDTTKQLDAWRKSVQSFMQEHGGDTTFGKVMSATGAITPAVAEGLAIPFTGGSSLIPLLSSGILYGLPGFKETLTQQLDSGAPVDVALEHALASGGMMMFGGRLVATGGKVLPQGLKASDRLLPQMAAAAAEGTAFSAADTGIQKTISGMNQLFGQQDTVEHPFSVEEMVTTALSMALARGAHVGITNLKGKAAADARIPYAKDNSYAGLAQRIAEAKGFNFKPNEPTLGKTFAKTPAPAEPELGKDTGAPTNAEPELGNLENVQVGEEPPFAKSKAAPAAETTPSEKAIADDLQAKGVPEKLARRMAKKQAAETKGAENVAGTEPTPSGESASMAGEPGAKTPGGPETPARDGVVPAGADVGLPATGEKPEPAALEERPKLNMFGLPVGVNFAAKPEKTTASELKAGDWIIFDGKPMQVRSVSPNEDGTLRVVLDHLLGTTSVDAKPTASVQRKIIEQKTKTETKAEEIKPTSVEEPPVAEGMTRLYHGSATPGRYTGPAWFSTNKDYAQNYREGAELQYVDVPTKWVNEKADPDNYGQTPDKGFTFNTELDSSFTGPRKPLTKTEAKEGTPSGTETVEAKQAEAQKQEAPAAPVEDIAIEPEVSPPSKGVVNAFEAAKRRIPIGESIGEQLAKEAAQEKADRKKVKDYEAAEKERKAEEDRIAKEEKATAEEQAAAETTERDAAAKARAGAVDVLGMEPQITGALQEIVNSSRFAPGIRKDARRHLETIAESATNPKADAHEAGLEMAFNFVTEQASKPRFMRQGKKPLPSIGRDKVSSVIDTIKERWGNAPEVVVASDINDPAVPTELQEADREAVARGATGVPAGVFHKGKVYIFADQMTSTKDVVEALLHEALGHYGLRGVFGKGLKPILEQVARDFPNEMQALKKKYGLDYSKPKDVAEAAEEILANLAATKPTAGIVQRAIAAVRRGLRKIGMDIKLSNNDLIANYILPARNFVEGERVNRATEGQPGFSRAAPTPEEREKEVKKATDAVKTGRVGYELGNATSNLARLRDPRFIWDEVKGLVESGDARVKSIISHFYDGDAMAYGGPGDVISGIKDAHEAIQKMSATEQVYLRRVAEMSNKIVDFFRAEPKKREAFADILNESTLDKYDPSDPPAGKSNPKLDADYAALGEKGQQLYKDLRDHYKVLNEVKNHLLEENIAQLDLQPEDREKLLAAVRLIFEKDSISPYFPLARFGDNVLEVKLPGKEKASYRFESLLKRNRAAREIARQQGKTLNEAEQDGIVKRTVSNDANMRVGLEKTSQLLKDAFAAIDTAQMDSRYTSDAAFKQSLKDGIYQAYLESMPEGNVRKLFMHRKGTPGFSSDILRTVNDTGMKMSRALAKLEHGPAIRQALELARRQIETNNNYEPFVTRMEEFANAVLTPTPEVNYQKWLNSAAGGVAKLSFLRNLTSFRSAVLQPMDIGLKGVWILLGNHGPEAIPEVLKMLKVWSQFGAIEHRADGTTAWRAPSIEYAKGLTPLERRAVRDAVDTWGVTRSTLTDSVFSKGRKPNTRVGNKVFDVGNEVLDKLVLGGMMHHGERLSREFQFMPSYRLWMRRFQKENPGKPGSVEEDANHTKAVDRAVQEVNEALGNYNPDTRQMMLRGVGGRLLGMYKFFPYLTTKLLVGNFFKMLPLFNKEGRAAAATKFFGVLSSHALVGGFVVLPSIALVSSLLDDAWNWFTNQHDAPDSMKHKDRTVWFRTEYLPNVLGKTGLTNAAKNMGIEDFPRLMTYGAGNYITGMDISGAINLNDMWLREPLPGKDIPSTMANWGQVLMGPSVNLGLDIGRALQLWSQGEYERGFEKITPASISKMLTEERYRKEGIQTPVGAQLAMPGTVPTNELVGQALGFAPAQIAQSQDTAIKTNASVKAINDEHKRIVDSLGDYNRKSMDPTLPQEKRERFHEKFVEELGRAFEFSVKNPDYQILDDEINNALNTNAKRAVESTLGGGIVVNEKNYATTTVPSAYSTNALKGYRSNGPVAEPAKSKEFTLEEAK